MVVWLWKHCCTASVCLSQDCENTAIQHRSAWAKIVKTLLYCIGLLEARLWKHCCTASVCLRQGCENTAVQHRSAWGKAVKTLVYSIGLLEPRLWKHCCTASVCLRQGCEFAPSVWNYLSVSLQLGQRCVFWYVKINYTVRFFWG